MAFHEAVCYTVLHTASDILIPPGVPDSVRAASVEFNRDNAARIVFATATERTPPG